MIGSEVFIQYGRCAGLAPLTGKGCISAEREYRGATLVFVNPIAGATFVPKWVNILNVQYSFAEAKAEALAS